MPFGAEINLHSYIYGIVANKFLEIDYFRSTETRARLFRDFMPLESSLSIIESTLLNPEYFISTGDETEFRLENGNYGVSLFFSLNYSRIIP